MSGVEILTSNEVTVVYEKFNWSNFGITITVVAVIAIIAGLIAGLYSSDCEIDIMFSSIVFIVLTVLVGLPIGGTTGEPIEYETQYKITIDDSVSMTEFLDKYEIIDQDGKIYTVRERE